MIGMGSGVAAETFFTHAVIIALVVETAVVRLAFLLSQVTAVSRETVYMVLACLNSPDGGLWVPLPFDVAGIHIYAFHPLPSTHF